MTECVLVAGSERVLLGSTSNEGACDFVTLFVSIEIDCFVSSFLPASSLCIHNLLFAKPGSSTVMVYGDIWFSKSAVTASHRARLGLFPWSCVTTAQPTLSRDILPLLHPYLA